MDLIWRIVFPIKHCTSIAVVGFILRCGRIINSAGLSGACAIIRIQNVHLHGDF